MFDRHGAESSSKALEDGSDKRRELFDGLLKALDDGGDGRRKLPGWAFGERRVIAPLNSEFAQATRALHGPRMILVQYVIEVEVTKHRETRSWGKQERRKEDMLIPSPSDRPKQIFA